MIGHGWRKSRYSENGANCVEVRPTADGIALRDSKDRGDGPVLAFDARVWAAFLAASGATEVGTAR